MKGSLHLTFGLAVGVAMTLNMNDLTSTFVNIPNTKESVAMAISEILLGSVFPDVDCPTSYVGKLTAPLSRYISKAGEFFGKTQDKHRGVCHDLGICLLMIIISYFYFPVMTFFFIGILSHLYLDMFNFSGVPFLWIKRTRVACISANSPNAKVFCYGMSGLALLTGILFMLL